MGFDLNSVLSSERHYCEFVCDLCHQLISLESIVTNCCGHPLCVQCFHTYQQKQQNDASTNTNTNSNTSIICPCCGSTDGLLLQQQQNQQLPLLHEVQPLAFRVLERIKVGCPLRKQCNCHWAGNYGDLGDHLLTTTNGNTNTAGSGSSSSSVSIDIQNQHSELLVPWMNPSWRKKTEKNQQQQQQQQQHYDYTANRTTNSTSRGRSSLRKSMVDTSKTMQQQQQQQNLENSYDSDEERQYRNSSSNNNNDNENLLVDFGNRPIKKKVETSSEEIAARIIHQRRKSSQNNNHNHNTYPKYRPSATRVRPDGPSRRQRHQPQHQRIPTTVSPRKSRGNVNGNRLSPVPPSSSTGGGGTSKRNKSAPRRINSAPSSAGQPPPPPDARESAHTVALVFKDKASDAFRKGSYGDAVQFYTQAIDTMVPHRNIEKVFCASLHSNRAASYLRINKFKECIKDCDASINLHDETHKAYIRKGWALIELGDLDEACAALNLGTQKCNSQELEFELNYTTELRDKMAQLEQAMGRQEYSRAIGLAASIRNSEKHKKIQLYLCRAHLGLADTERAIEKANFVLGAGATNAVAITSEVKAEALCVRARAYFWNCAFREAIRDATDGSAFLETGKELLHQIQTVEESLQDGRNSASSNSKKASDSYTVAIEQVASIPHSTTLFRVLHTERAEVLLANSDSLAALKDAELVLASKFEDARVWQVKVKALNATSQHQKLQTELQNAIATTWGSGQQFLKTALEEVKKELGKKAKKYVKLHGPDYYKVLEVDRDAPIDVIRKSYRKKCMKYHPDKLLRQQLTEEERKEAEGVFKLITEAMDFLKEPEWRKMYDQGQDPRGIRQAALHKRQDSGRF